MSINSYTVSAQILLYTSNRYTKIAKSHISKDVSIQVTNEGFHNVFPLIVNTQIVLA